MKPGVHSCVKTASIESTYSMWFEKILYFSLFFFVRLRDRIRMWTPSATSEACVKVISIVSKGLTRASKRVCIHFVPARKKKINS